MCKFFLLLLIFNGFIVATNQVCILVHGTWGLEEDWHQPGHPFYENLKTNLALSQTKLIDFKWCGTLSYEKRRLAGLSLANLINSYPPQTNFIIIAHSHGGNVGIIASQQLQQPGKIKSFYALGTPIDNVSYLPNMKVISNFYNLFSFGDLYQTVLGMHTRLMPSGHCIYNINLEINNQKPHHEALHCATLAKWLLKIPNCLKDYDCHNHFFAQFYDNLAPVIVIDHNFESKLDQDFKLHGQIHTNLTDFTNGRIYNKTLEPDY